MHYKWISILLKEIVFPIFILRSIQIFTNIQFEDWIYLDIYYICFSKEHWLSSGEEPGEQMTDEILLGGTTRSHLSWSKSSTNIVDPSNRQRKQTLIGTVQETNISLQFLKVCKLKKN